MRSNHLHSQQTGSHHEQIIIVMDVAGLSMAFAGNPSNLSNSSNPFVTDDPSGELTSLMCIYIHSYDSPVNPDNPDNPWLK